MVPVALGTLLIPMISAASLWLVTLLFPSAEPTGRTAERVRRRSDRPRSG